VRSRQLSTAGSTTSPAAFYDTVYGNTESPVVAAIRAETFREDVGQNSWLTSDELRRFLGWLGLSPAATMLEVGCGTGGPALFAVEATGCSLIGIELHARAVAVADHAARERRLSGRARFLQMDARRPLPFADAMFDAVMCIDSINHIYEREPVFAEWHRVLRPGSRALFTDPLTLNGAIRRDELLTRTGSLGEQVLTAPGVNERLLRSAGFTEMRTEDVTDNMAQVAAARRRARSHHIAELDRLEGTDARAAYDEYLRVVAALAHERRLTRLAHLAFRST
jgi:SAM-dependent methyltransferase